MKIDDLLAKIGVSKERGSTNKEGKGRARNRAYSWKKSIPENPEEKGEQKGKQRLP